MPTPPSKPLGIRDRYRFLTRGLGWETTYQPMDRVFPFDKFEGIKIHDWDQWEDPFRLTMDSYWKLQAEKERRVYAVIDSVAQNNGHLGVTDGRYFNTVKLFLTGITPLEYASHRGFAHLGRHLRGVGPRIAGQMQSFDELRHTQTQIHTISHYNRYFQGLHNWRHWHDRVWYLSVPKSFFDDAMTAGPFEFLTAISFSFEYLLTNFVFVPFMSGAAFNGDMATVSFGFSSQSDESRHMTLGLEVLKFMLEQDADNVPIVQRWIDKWFWRSYRLLALVAPMMDYMLPKRVMSWREAWDIWFEEAGSALFDDLARYGLRMPKYHEVASKEKNRLSHEVWAILYQHSHAAAFHTWSLRDHDYSWLSEKYPETFDRLYRPRFEYWAELEKNGHRFLNPGLPQLCTICQIPMGFTEPDDPTRICFRDTVYRENRYHFCSDGCRDIFLGEPEKYVQSWLPVHQIFQGNCGGPTLEDVVAWYRLEVGRDNGDYVGSPDEKNWEAWAANNRVSSSE